MIPAKWRQSFVYCEGGFLAVYQFYNQKDDEAGAFDKKSREVVLLAAGCANSVGVYTLLDERSLPDFLYNNGFDVWALDLRGHGESEPPPGPREWDIGVYAFVDTRTVIDYVCNRTGCEKVHYIGHSMGGMIGMALAAHPETYRKLHSVTALGSAIYLGSSIFNIFGPVHKEYSPLTLHCTNKVQISTTVALHNYNTVSREYTSVLSQ